VPPTYLDFDLLIQRLPEGYRARVLESPAGEAMVDFQVPFSPLELENFVLRIGRTLSQFRRDAAPVRRLESTERLAIKEFGGRLFETVFSEDVEGCLRASLNEAYRRDAGLRIRLRLADTPELADIPWEYLYSPSLNRFFGLSPETPLVRYVELAEAPRPISVKPPLRVLVMISSPTDYPSLDLAQEWEKLEAAVAGLQQAGKLTLARIDQATLSELQRQLRRNDPHVFHFLGHGGFIEAAQDGALLLEDEHNRGRLVSGQDLAMLLQGHRSLRLAILNACEGARASQSDPFAGVAQSLVQQGIPAVIAMQFEITDQAAITFAQEFYGALADGYPVDASLTEARRAIFAAGHELEWATPVLYMRSPNGRLFRMQRRPTPPVTPPSPAPEAAEPSPQVEAPPIQERVTAEHEVRTGAQAVDSRPMEGEPVRPDRPTGLPPPWWWMLIFGGAVLLVAGVVLPFLRVSDEPLAIVDLTPWSAAEPLVAVFGAIAATIGTVRPGLRHAGKGPLIGFGLYGVLLYLAYILVATGEYEGLNLGGPPSPEVGGFVGLAGGLLLLWAGLSLPAPSGSTPAPRPGAERVLSLGIGLAFFGAAVLVITTIASPIVADTTLLQVAYPLAIPPLGVAAGVAICGFMVLGWSHRRDTAAGAILALAVEAFLFQFTILTASVGFGSAAGAVYVALVASGTMLVGALLTFRGALRLRSG
jgi:CHAT domain